MYFKPLTLFWITIVYSLLLISLGIFGYYKTASIASLASSLSFGIPLLGTAYFFLQRKKWAYRITVFLISSLCFVFLYRFTLSFKILPLSMALLSLLLLSFFIIKKKLPTGK